MTGYGWDDAMTTTDGIVQGEDEEGPVVLYCTACQAWRWCDWLCEGAYEGDDDDADWARVCESCASWVQEDDDEPGGWSEPRSRTTG